MKRIGKNSSENPYAINYLDIVEEALCFGWIDINKRVTDRQLVQRLSPRNKNSRWTELNKERVRRLRKLGLMTPDGESILPDDMDPKEFKVDEDILYALDQDPIAEDNIKKFPDLYTRVRIDNIQSFKKNSKLFNNRLNKFIEYTHKSEMYGNWNDNVRPINY